MLPNKKAHFKFLRLKKRKTKSYLFNNEGHVLFYFRFLHFYDSTLLGFVITYYIKSRLDRTNQQCSNFSTNNFILFCILFIVILKVN